MPLHFFREAAQFKIFKINWDKICSLCVIIVSEDKKVNIMTKGKKFKRIISVAVVAVAALTVLTAVIPRTPSAAYAKARPDGPIGITSSGVQIRNEKNVLAVQNETLTFDICDFPMRNNGTNLTEYKSTVTAEYTFVNTSESTVHAEMAFPSGNLSNVMYSNDGALWGKPPEITVNGEAVQCEIRHTIGQYGLQNLFENGASQISDAYYEDEFYSPDTPVTAYKVKVDRSGYSQVIARGNVACDNSKTRFLCGTCFFNEMHFCFYESSISYEELVESGQYVFYVLGDNENFKIDWTVQEEVHRRGVWGSVGVEYRDVGLDVQVTEITDMKGRPIYPTLKDLILSARDGNCAVSEVDFYNGVASNYLSKCEDKNQAYAGDFRIFPTASSFCEWYTYGVDIEPNGRIVNSITAPIYPTVLMTYEPYVYEYVYYIQPAAKWDDFGSLNIKINTPYYPSGLRDEFFRSGNGYSAKFKELPEGEMSFCLSASESPEYVGGRGGVSLMPLAYFILGIIIFVFVAGIIAVVTVTVVTVSKCKKT